MKESTLFEKFCSIKRSLIRRFSKIFIVRALIAERSRFRFFVGIGRSFHRCPAEVRHLRLQSCERIPDGAFHFTLEVNARKAEIRTI